MGIRNLGRSKEINNRDGKGKVKEKRQVEEKSQESESLIRKQYWVFSHLFHMHLFLLDFHGSKSDIVVMLESFTVPCMVVQKMFVDGTSRKLKQHVVMSSM